jgi:hypothetical protein
MFVLQWSGLGELVSVMEQIPCYYVHEECESRLSVTVGVNASREWEDGVKEKLYEAGLL